VRQRSACVTEFGLLMSQRVSFAGHAGIPDASEAFRRAVAYQAQGLLREAEQLYEIVLKADGRHFESIYRMGIIRLHQGRFADALPLFRRALKVDKNSAEAQFHLAVALTGLGRLEDAVSRYERALALKPLFPEAHNNLGHTLQLMGRHEQAIEQYERALSLQPAYAEARNNLGNTLQMLGHSERAIAQLEKALAIRPNYAEAHNNLGNVLATLGRFDEALAHCQQALAIRPRYAEAHITRGNALAALRLREEAVAEYEKALALNPRNLAALDGLGTVLLRLGRTDDAITYCERALAIEPGRPEAHNNLGNALRSIGRVEEAIAHFEQAIALAPRKADGYWNLATSKRFHRGDARLNAIMQLARDIDSLDLDNRIGLHFAVGKAFADIGEHEHAAHHWMRGNSLHRQRIAYDEAATLDRFTRIQAVFTAELIRAKHGLGDPSSVPVFIIGMPRSGTTLIEQILASHPRVFGAGEVREMGRLARNIRNGDASEFPEAMVAISGELLRRLGADYLRTLRGMAPEAERVTDKMPANFAMAGLIHLALPNARIVHVRRDPRDTALSCFAALFANRQAFAYDLAELGRYMRAYETLMEHWRKVLPDDVMLEVHYEEVLADLETQARRMLAHCGLEWADACLAFHKTRRSVRTASAAEVRQPIYWSSAGRWRDYEGLLQSFLRALNSV
jgi:tetratricopeptide (TPR) repeat protein